MGTLQTKMYKVERAGWTSYFDLFVSPSAKAMRAYIKKYFEAHNFLIPRVDDTLGLVQPIQSKDGMFAACFLNENNLGVGTVAHECLHIAMAHERFVSRFGMDYGDGDSGLDDEERLAYLLTDTVSGVYNVLYDNGHIKSKRISF